MVELPNTYPYPDDSVELFHNTSLCAQIINEYLIIATKPMIISCLKAPMKKLLSYKKGLDLESEARQKLFDIVKDVIKGILASYAACPPYVQRSFLRLT